MKKKLLFIFVLFANTIFSFCQETIVKNDSIILEKEKKQEVSILLTSRNIWRGQSFGGNSLAIQPEINFAITKKLTLGFWATSNFINKYYFLDGTSANGYQEIDFSVSYHINKFLKVQLSDFYWPSVEKIDGINNSYFNYGNNSVKTVDANLIFDFSTIWRPLKATVSTFIVGNDFRYDVNGENPEQNYTTYLETSYIFENIMRKISKKAIQNINLEPSFGVVLNNQAQYYSAGDYNKISILNLGFKISKKQVLSKNFNLPISLSYVHNAAIENTEQFGRNFIFLGFKLSYE